MTPDLNPKSAGAPAAGSGRAPVGPGNLRSAGPGAPAGIDFRLFLRALKRRWLLAAILGVLLAGVAGAAVWFLLPPGDHLVVSQLHVSAIRPVIAREGHQVSYDGDFQTYKQTQAAMIRSRVVLAAALRSPTLARNAALARVDDQLEWLEKELKVGFGPSPEIMHISLAGGAEDVSALKPIVEAVTVAYISEIVNKDRLVMEDRRRQLSEIALRYRKKLEGIRQSTRALRQKLGSGDEKTLALKQQLVQTEYNRAVNELTSHKAELRSLRTTLEQLEAGKAEAFTVNKAEVDAAVERHPDVVRLRAELLLTERHRDELLEKAARPDLPIVKKAQTAVEDKKKELERKKTQVQRSTADTLKDEKKHSAGATIVTVKTKINLLEHLQKLLETECESLARVQASFNKDKIELEEFRPELNGAEQMASQLTHRAEVMAVEAEAPPRVTRMQEDTIVRRPNEQMRKLRFSALAILAGFGLAVFGVGFMEYRTRRLASAADVTKHVGLNVIGALPFCRGKQAHNRTAQQQLKEAVDSARTLLLHASGSEGIKVVQVVSSVSGEGKTSLACHLASSLARAGRRTLLLDADLRKPNVHSVFGVQQGPGISEVLRGECTAESVIQETPLAGLHVLCAGRLDDRALCAVAQTGLSSLLTQLRERYDFVVVDSSPVLPVPDALMMAQHTDGVLFAVMEDVTRLHQLASAVERMNRVGSQLLGAVVNGSREAEHQTYGQYARYLKTGQS